MEMKTKYFFRLLNVARFAGKKLDNPYSVGEHSYRVAVISMMMADQYNKEQEAKGSKDRIDTLECLRKALLHDVEESITGDVPSPVKKYGNLREELRSASEEIMKETILPDTPYPEMYLKMWVEDKDNETGEVIKVADKLEGLLVSYYEVKRGNRYLDKSFASHLKWFVEKENVALLEKYTFAYEEVAAVFQYIENHEVRTSSWGSKIIEAVHGSNLSFMDKFNSEKLKSLKKVS